MKKYTVGYLFIVICFGYLGVHKFMDGNSKKGFLYLFTVGLFGLGWMWDILVALFSLGKPRKATYKTRVGNRVVSIDMTGVPRRSHAEIAEARAREAARNLEWQKAVIANSPDTLVTSEAQRITATKEIARGDLKIIKDCYHLVSTTVSPEVFFSRWDLLLEKLAHLDMLHEFTLLEAFEPPVYANELNREKPVYIQRFLTRYFDDVYEKAEVLKTDKAKIGRYQKFYDSLQPYYDRLKPEHIEFIEVKYGIYVKQPTGAK